mmetsp:Transcript_79647/g.191123  ORF Transcript_79647/g.191123 Transcript_79647/m.191123 type:complete len:389 (+) Transcript_79647:539-1705(+)
MQAGTTPAVLGGLPKAGRAYARPAHGRLLSTEAGRRAELCAQHDAGLDPRWPQGARLLQQRQPIHAPGARELWRHRHPGARCRGGAEAQDHLAIASFPGGADALQAADRAVLRLHAQRLLHGALFVVARHPHRDLPPLQDRPLRHLRAGLHWGLCPPSDPSSVRGDVPPSDRPSPHRRLPEGPVLVSGPPQHPLLGHWMRLGPLPPIQGQPGDEATLQQRQAGHSPGGLCGPPLPGEASGQAGGPCRGHQPAGGAGAVPFRHHRQRRLLGVHPRGHRQPLGRLHAGRGDGRAAGLDHRLQRHLLLPHGHRHVGPGLHRVPGGRHRRGRAPGRGGAVSGDRRGQREAVRAAGHAGRQARHPGGDPEAGQDEGRGPAECQGQFHLVQVLR